jgi:hypothetical protein
MQLPLDETECTLNFMDECMLQMQSAVPLNGKPKGDLIRDDSRLPRPTKGDILD